MKQSEIFLGMVVFFIIGIFATLFTMLGAPSGLYSRTQLAIGECERSLPRDQYCKIIAVVDEGK